MRRHARALSIYPCPRLRRAAHYGLDPCRALALRGETRRAGGAAETARSPSQPPLLPPCSHREAVLDSFSAQSGMRIWTWEGPGDIYASRCSTVPLPVPHRGNTRTGWGQFGFFFGTEWPAQSAFFKRRGKRLYYPRMEKRSLIFGAYSQTKHLKSYVWYSIANFILCMLHVWRHSYILKQWCDYFCVAFF